MEYTSPTLFTSYAVPDLYSSAKGFASDPLYCDPNLVGDLTNPGGTCVYGGGPTFD